MIVVFNTLIVVMSSQVCACASSGIVCSLFTFPGEESIFVCNQQTKFLGFSCLDQLKRQNLQGDEGTQINLELVTGPGRGERGSWGWIQPPLTLPS